MAAKKKEKSSNSEIEQELKIQLSARDLEKVFKTLKKKAIGKKVEHKYMPRAYYDTPDLELYQNAISVRMQYKPGKGGKIGGYEQTVKFDLPHGATVAKGAFFRKECKDMLNGHKPQLALISDTEGRAIARSFHSKKVIHIFTAAIERRSFELKAGGGKKRGIVEVAFDVGEIILDSNGQHYPFSEIEVEVKKGSAEAILAIEKKIRRIARSARIQPLSKAQHGSRLYRRSVQNKKSR
jgi:inorganic triphosphatase YgiF